ncbi:MAG: peptide deformylase [Actinobacteria bacterium]|nr:peptide deformylase [Actinomycetota bacterium]MBE3114432.1 peptide deformylase [Actinomycetota bacterium]
MSVKKIRKIGDPVLREKSRSVEKIDSKLLELAKDMIDTLNNEGGVGLAAPQIGITRRVIIVNFDDKIQTFINPVIEVLDDKKIESDESCLSIYSIKGFFVKRFFRIKVKAKDLKGNDVTLIGEDLLARIFQHEIDHLNGILYIDHLDRKSKRELLSKINEIKLNI